MGSFSREPPKPWIETPTIFSAALSRHAGCNIYLKLENLQPSGSFKSRGIGNLMFRAAEAADPGQDVHFYCSSGGNAGLACATAAITLRHKATIVVPLTTGQLVIGKLRDLGADVIQIGANWGEADRHLRDNLLANHDPASKGVYVPPFDHPDIWSGASSLVEEMVRQMRDVHDNQPIHAVVCSVGGGGLLCGIMEGFEKAASSPKSSGGRPPTAKPRVLAVETVGADSLNASVRAGTHITLPAITSIATTLGAPRVAARAYEWASREDSGVTSIVVSDAEAVMGSARLLDHARLLAEPACGATIATAYNGDLRKYLGQGMSDADWAAQNVVLVVCGGSGIDLEALCEYKKKYGV